MDVSDWAIVAAIVGVGATLWRILASLRADVRADVQRIDAGMADLRERMAKLEGLLEGLRDSITGRRVASGGDG